MSVRPVGSETQQIHPAARKGFDRVLSQREKAYLDRSFQSETHEGQRPAKAKESIGRYIDLKV